MVPDIGGVRYAAFVAPGLLASSCMNGAITDGFFNIFFKLHFQKTYDGILATPMRLPFARTVEDCDIVMGLLVMPMFLFSAIFFPVGQLPAPV